MNYIIKTEGLMCGHCDASVETALLNVAGVTDACNKPLRAEPTRKRRRSSPRSGRSSKSLRNNCSICVSLT